MANNLLPPQNSDFYWWTTDNPTGKTNINEEGRKLKTTEEKQKKRSCLRRLPTLPYAPATSSSYLPVSILCSTITVSPSEGYPEFEDQQNVSLVGLQTPLGQYTKRNSMFTNIQNTSTWARCWKSWKFYQIPDLWREDISVSKVQVGSYKIKSVLCI